MIRRLVLVTLACACSSKPPPPATPCVVHFSGNVDETVTATSCAVTSDDAGAMSFTAHASGAAISSFDVSVALPALTGSFSSETSAASWDASAATGDAGCTFSGGDTDVPAGSFTLAIDGDAGSTAHGTLTMILSVHAPEATACGPEDVENVELTF